MYGFTIKYSSKTHVQSKHENKRILFKTETKKQYLFEHAPLKKYQQDQVFHENDKYIIGIHGIVLNLQALKKAYGVSNFFTLIEKQFSKKKILFIQEFKGQFCGFVFDKRSEELIFFNNKTDTKQIFYSQDENGIIISNFFQDICAFRNQNKLNESAVYEMLCFGSVLEEKTLVTGVSKLLAGEFLSLKNQKLNKEIYYDYNQIDITIESKKKGIALFNEGFEQAVKLEYEKDLEYNLAHFSTLSGGLDSRMTVMIADKMDYKTKCFCFSQTNYEDELIARKIALDLGLEFEFIALDGSQYLLDLQKMVACNAGLQFYNGSAHYNYALEQTSLKKYGLLHSGQIGDALLGGLVSGEQNYFSKSISNRFLDKISIKKPYRDEELFKLYNRIFNLTNFGSFVVEKNGSVLVSPFFDDELMQIGFSMHPKLKYNQNIYIDWINEKQTAVTKYTWERTSMKPNAVWKTSFSRYTKKLNRIYKKLNGKNYLLSMTPDEYWFQKSKDLQLFYAKYYNENIKLLNANKELFKDIKNYYQQATLHQKSIVLTVLEAIKQFNIQL